MNKDAILKTVITRWSDEDEAYIAESPLADTIGGVGDTPEEAMEVHKRFVEGEYLAYLENKHAVYNKRGRPSKGKIKVSLDIRPDLREAIKAMAAEFGISQGEVLEYLHARYQAEQSKPPDKKTA